MTIKNSLMAFHPAALVASLLLVLAAMAAPGAPAPKAPPVTYPLPIPITATSTYSTGATALHAFDGNPKTGWGSWKFVDKPLWLQFDFGKPVTINTINILWGTPQAADYEIQVGDKINQMKVVHQRRGCKGGREALTGLAAQGRFVRIVCNRPLPGKENFFIQEVEFPDPGLKQILNDRVTRALRERRQAEAQDYAASAARLRAQGVDELIFAARQVVKEHWYANFGYYAAEASKLDFLTERPWREGAKLCRLDLRDGKVKTILADARGGIRDPQVHYDGNKILFSYRKGGTDNYHLYEINADGSGLRQLTDGPFDDLEPTYLADGGIVFVSSRCKRWVSCWKTQVAILYRCDSDGKNIHTVSANIEQDNTPWPLSDGRILYMRWEYVDRSQVHYHHLWTMNPDGTGHTVYYGNLTSGTVMLDAKPVPGTDKVVASFSPGHGREEHKGFVTIVSPKHGPDDNDSAKRLTKSSEYRDPWALSEDCVIAATADTIVLVNGAGETKPLFRLPQADAMAGLEVSEPRPLLARPRERIIPTRTDLTTTTGRMLLANVYEGRNMAGVKRGEIKKLLVLEALAKPINFSGGMEPLTLGGSFNLERILGTVPVEPDGSAYFEAPALRSIFFVALDAQGLSVKRMQSFASVAPGETLGCVGCHEQRVLTSRPRPANLMALRRGPSPIEPVREVPEIMQFPRDVQPVLDRLCLKCHDAGVRKGFVDLSGDRGPFHSHAYATLIARGQVADGRNRPKSNYPPRALGSSASPLMQKLEPTHHGVKASARDKRIVALWLDSGATYPGTYACLGTGMLNATVEARLGTVEKARLGQAAAAVQRRCVACHCGGMPVSPFRYSNANYFDLTRPEKSLLLLAPLKRSAGGLELCRAKGSVKADALFASTADPDYAKILGGIAVGKEALDRIKRFDMPGFRPCAEWVREMKRYGVLPADLASDAPINVYATEQKYWESLWFHPQPTQSGG